MKNEQNIERDLADQFVRLTHRNVFLTGRAGTGKTTLLKEVLQKTEKKTVVVAPTGVAAINAGGMTIHSMFQLPSKSFLPTKTFIGNENIVNRQQLVNIQKIRKERRRLFQELELLVIDEISMVRADLMDAIDFTLRRIRKNQKPFGGVQLLVIGDLFQLAPVVKENVWKDLRTFYETPYFFSSIAWQHSNALTIELKKIYRQEDSVFISILNNIRQGIKREEDIDRLNENFSHKARANETITITTHNRKADAINQTELKRIEEPEIKLRAKVTGQFNESSYPTKAEIVLKIGAQVMFIRNHSDGLYYNGKVGTVVDKTEDGILVFCEEDNADVLVEAIEWKNIRYDLNESTAEIEPKELGVFEQYPLKLAWAVTVHKSQGLTFDHAIVDLEDSFAPGQLYVALSRCRSLDGLILSSRVRPENIIIDHRLTAYHEKTTLNKDIQSELDTSKQAYEKEELIRAFDLKKIVEHLQTWEDELTDSELPGKADIFILVRNAMKEVKKLQRISETFKKQIRAIFNQPDDLENYLMLKERVEKAIDYFTENVHNALILPINTHRRAYMVKPKTRKYITGINGLINHLWSYINKLYGIEYKDQKMYDGPLKYEKVELFDAKSPKPKHKKRIKGETHRITLEMWKEGKSIMEIARERNLVIGTIQSHMSKWIKEGEVSIYEFMEDKKVEEIWNCMVKNPDLSSTDIRNKLPFQVGYSEIEMVRSWGAYSGKSQSV